MKLKYLLSMAIAAFSFLNSFGQTSTISGYVFNDLNNDSLYESGEGLSNIKVWLFDLNESSTKYRVIPVDSVVTDVNGLYTFSNVAATDYQVRVMMASMPPTISRAVVDNDAYPNGLTNVMGVDGSSAYNNINFGFDYASVAPTFTSDRIFQWNSSNTFINTTSQTYNLTPETCNGNPFNPTITWKTDRTNTPGGSYGTNTYPQAYYPGAILGVDFPGNLKGGINPLDTTFQLIFGDNSYTPVNNDRQNTTVIFSNSVDNVKFSIYDIDQADPQRATGRIDHLKVTGYDGATPVMPVILSPSAAPWNTVSGNTIYGFADYPIWSYTLPYNSQNQDHGTVNVYFQNKIDSIVIEYEEWAPVMLAGKGVDDATPAAAAPDYDWVDRLAPNAPTSRGISIGSIDYSFYCNAAMPVSLANFAALQNGCNSVLQWKTSFEQNLNYFGIEYSTDGSNFQTIGSVKASDFLTGSSYLYPVPPSGVIGYYRLRMTDYDGDYKLSNIVSINPCYNNTSWSVAPNPINRGDNLMITIYSADNNSKQSIIEVFDSYGNKILQQSAGLSQGNNMLPLNTSKMASGVYLIRLIDGNNNGIGNSQKIIVR
jgi:hypothetical protein